MVHFDSTAVNIGTFSSVNQSFFLDNFWPKVKSQFLSLFLQKMNERLATSFGNSIEVEYFVWFDYDLVTAFVNVDAEW